MKKYLCSIIIILFFSSTITFSQFGGGDGTEQDPYKLGQPIHFNAFYDTLQNGVLNYSQWHWGKHFIMMNNIVINILNFYSFDKFSGHFHGNNKTMTITNIFTNYPVFFINSTTFPFEGSTI